MDQISVQSQPMSSGKVTFLYLRVSTQDQKFGMESQERALKEYCQRSDITQFKIFSDEGISGAKNSRPGLDLMMNQVREGNCEKLIVYSFSRFARSTTHLLTALEEMKKYNTEFISITEKIETNSPMGRAFFTVIAAISQLERELIVERVKNGLRNARAKGIHIGRKKTRPSEIIRALLKKGLPYRTISSVTNCSHGSVGLEKRLMLQEELAAKQAKKKEVQAIQEAGGLQVLDETAPW